MAAALRPVVKLVCITCMSWAARPEFHLQGDQWAIEGPSYSTGVPSTHCLPQYTLAKGFLQHASLHGSHFGCKIVANHAPPTEVQTLQCDPRGCAQGK